MAAVFASACGAAAMTGLGSAGPDGGSSSSSSSSPPPPCQHCTIDGLGRCLASEGAIERGEVIFSEVPLVVAPAVSESTDLRAVAQALCGRQSGLVGEHEGAEMVWGERRANSMLAFLEACLSLPLETRRKIRRNFDHLPDEPSALKQLVEATAAVLVKSQIFPAAEEGELEDLCEIKVVNCHEGGSGGSALYEVLSRLAHSCSPNAIFIASSDKKPSGESGGYGSVVAARKIQPEEVLSISYMSLRDLLGPRPSRQALLRGSRGFSCRCDLCSGPDYRSISGHPIRLEVENVVGGNNNDNNNNNNASKCVHARALKDVASRDAEVGGVLGEEETKRSKSDSIVGQLPAPAVGGVEEGKSGGDSTVGQASAPLAGGLGERRNGFDGGFSNLEVGALGLTRADSEVDLLDPQGELEDSEEEGDEQDSEEDDDDDEDDGECSSSEEDSEEDSEKDSEEESEEEREGSAESEAHQGCNKDPRLSLRSRAELSASEKFEDQSKGRAAEFRGHLQGTLGATTFEGNFQKHFPAKFQGRIPEESSQSEAYESVGGRDRSRSRSQNRGRRQQWQNQKRSPRHPHIGSGFLLHLQDSLLAARAKAEDKRVSHTTKGSVRAEEKVLDKASRLVSSCGKALAASGGEREVHRATQLSVGDAGLALDLAYAVDTFVTASNACNRYLNDLHCPVLAYGDVGREAQFAKDLLLVIWKAAAAPTNTAPSALRTALQKLSTGCPSSFKALSPLLQECSKDSKLLFGPTSEEAQFASRMEGEWTALVTLLENGGFNKILSMNAPESRLG